MRQRKAQWIRIISVLSGAILILLVIEVAVLLLRPRAAAPSGAPEESSSAWGAASALLDAAPSAAAQTVQSSAEAEPPAPPQPADGLESPVQESAAGAEAETVPPTAAEDIPAPSAEPEPLSEPTAAPAEPPAPAQESAPQGPDMDALQSGLQSLVSGYAGTWSVYVRDLDSGGSVSIGESPLVAASLIKLYVAGAYCQAVENGTLSDSYGDDLYIMLSESDNSACNRLIRVLGNGDSIAGMAVVNQFSADMGFGSSQLNREMLAASPPENYTSTGDCGALLASVYAGTFVSANTSQRLLSALLAQSRTGKIPAGVPSGIRTANKTGELSNVENDAAIVWAAHPYVLCVMSNEVSPGAAQSNIREISAFVYQYMSG